MADTKNKFVLAKLDPMFLEKARAVERVRYFQKKDKKPVGIRRLTKAIARYEPVWKVLEGADFVEDKKAQLSVFTSFNIFTFMIVALLAVLLFAGLIWVQGTIFNVFQDVGIQNDAQPHPYYTYPCVDDPTQTCSGNFYVNMTEAANVTFGNVNQSIQALRMVALAYILGFAVCLIITNTLIRIHPLWFMAYMLMSILAIIFAAPISNAYESLMTSSIYDGGLASFGAANFILLNLPTFVLFISIIGGVFLFINLIRTGNEQNLA